MSDNLRSENTVLVISCAGTEYAIDVHEEFQDVNLLQRGPDGTMRDVWGTSFTDDADKAVAVAGALMEVAMITRKEQGVQDD